MTGLDLYTATYVNLATTYIVNRMENPTNTTRHSSTMTTTSYSVMVGVLFVVFLLVVESCSSALSLHYVCCDLFLPQHSRFSSQHS